MENSTQKPVLSICIPTFNRPHELTNSLHSILSQKFFASRNDIEIIVYDSSDSSCSQKACQVFVEQHREKFFYYKNNGSREDADANIKRVLHLAHGEFRKLANDTLIWRDGSVEAIHSLALQTKSTKPLLFALNGARKASHPYIKTGNLEDFLRVCSYNITWGGSFGIWEDDLAACDAYPLGTGSTHLDHVGTILQILSKKSSAVISTCQYFDVQASPYPKDYDLAFVFAKNYLAMLKTYVPHQISEELYNQEKRDILINHILPYYYNLDHNFVGHSLDYLDDEYFREEYYLPSITAERTKFFQKCFSLPLDKLAGIWRRLNVHNKTYLIKPCDISAVKVGRYSYGPLKVISFTPFNEKLLIGNFVSISEGVSFLLGGNHATDGFSTYPFNVMMGKTAFEAASKGPIVIGDDVWIGYGSTILSGSSIGQGAVIAAGSVVTGIVPPYSIVAGVPARVKKYRFEKEIRDKLIDFDFSIFEPSVCFGKIDFYAKLTVDNIDQMLNDLRAAR